MSVAIAKEVIIDAEEKEIFAKPILFGDHCSESVAREDVTWFLVTLLDKTE